MYIRVKARRFKWGHLSLAAAAVLILLASPGAARGQVVVDLNLGYQGALLSTEDWSPGHGPSFGLAAGWGRTRLHVDYGLQTRDGGAVTGYCEFFGCVDGPFDESFFLHVLRLGVGRSVYRSGALDLGGAVRGGLFVQGRHLTHVDTGDELDRGRTTDLGVGVAAEARVTRWGRSLAPRLWLAYDRIFGGECPADGTCYGARNRLELGVGVSWRR
jgi:hypothetical protein